MADIKFTNFARATLAIGAASGATSLTLASGKGALFPALTAGQYFYLTLENVALTREIVKVTARSTDSLTVVRAQDGTTAVGWNAGDVAALRWNAATIADTLATAVQQTAATGAVVGSSGTTAQQPGTPAAGYLRHNSTDDRLEFYGNVAWKQAQDYDAAAAKTNSAQTFTATQRTNETTDNDGSFDLNAAMDFKCTPTAGFTLTFTNIPTSPVVQKGTIMLVNPSAYSVAAHANTKVGAATLAALSAAGTYELAYRTSNGLVYVTASGALA
jgi:hypothetical protein